MAAERLALVDYGAGNLRSVENALRAAGAADVAVTADADRVRAADRIVLPGVGAFAACMTALCALPGMVEALDETARAKGRPFLGICVGMQLLADAGEEHGRHAGLVMAEIELPHPCALFDVPGWVGRDVTSEERYSNSFLAQMAPADAAGVTEQLPLPFAAEIMDARAASALTS